jgi:uncharacterized protein (TIGR03083 family)
VEHDPGWEHERYCAATGAEIARLAALISDADPAAPVLTCPEWTLARMTRHLGIVHRWAEYIVRTRAPGRVNQRDIDAGLPATEDAYPGWLDDGGALLVATLRAAGPDAPVWAWGADQHARWWARRMLHETTVHRADAELALLPYGGRTSAGLAELPSGGETVHLHATDRDGEWMITLGPDGMTWQRGHGKGSVAVRGPAAVLLLFAYGRVRPDDERLSAFGDRDLLATWQEKTAL